MNHLREIMEVEFLHNYGAAGAKAAYNDFVRIAGNAMAFLTGDYDDWTDFQAVGELCRLPFPTCWFESVFEFAGMAPILLGVLAHQEAPSSEVQLWVFTRIYGQWAIRGAMRGDTIEPGKYLKATSFDSASRTAQVEMLAGAVGMVQCFLSVLNCENVKRRVRHPDPRLQRARMRRGKSPLFSSWTLHLKGDTPVGGAGSPASGTRASPRVHLRRGHFRQYSDGKTVWVQSHAVGSRAAGVVHKDYSLSAP